MELWAIATVILIAGMVDDLLTKKVHNGLVLGLFTLALFSSLFFRGFEGSVIGLSSLALAMVLGVPLFSFNVLGGGDVKLFAAFALAVEPKLAFWTLVYSIIWGGFFGLTRSTLQKQLLALVKSTYKIAARQKVQVQEIHKIPYTFALLLGWFTQLTIMRAGLS